MRTFAKKNTWLRRRPLIDFGWGNGYVCIPKDNPLFGKSYDEIHDLIPHLSVHYGLTFSENAQNLDWDEIPSDCKDCWIVGFDTAHSGDSLSLWPDQDSVLNEAGRLRDQLIEYSTQKQNKS